MDMLEMHNGLTFQEHERLDILAEECSEVIKAIMKIKRFGYDNSHPKEFIDNRESLENELGDLFAAYQILKNHNDINDTSVMNRKVDKLGMISKYLYHTKINPLKINKEDIFVE